MIGCSLAKRMSRSLGKARVGRDIGLSWSMEAGGGTGGRGGPGFFDFSGDFDAFLI